MSEINDLRPRTEISASFVILGFSCSHDDISKRIGIKPNATWSKGDRINNAEARRRTTGWRLSSDLPKQASLMSHARRILEQVYPGAKSLHDLNAENILLSFAVYIYNLDRPALQVDHDTVSKLSEL